MSIRAIIIPTEHRAVSIGLGVLIPFVALLVGSFIHKGVVFWLAVLSPFVAGFVASTIYGSESSRGVGYNILIALVASIASIFGLLVAMGVRERPAMEPLGFAIYMAMLILPFSLPGYIVLSVLGGIFGRLTARAMGR